MIDRSTEWQRRFDRMLLAVLWVVGGVAIALTVGTRGPGPATLLAAGVQLASIASFRLVLRHDPARLVWLPTILGLVAGLLAAALTGGSSSPYVLVVVVPIFYAAVRGGTIPGAAATIAAVAGLAGVDRALGLAVPTATLMQAVLLYGLVGFTFAEARRILIEEQQRTDALERQNVLDESRLRRLEASHDLLESLSALATDSELNPVTVGQAALRDLAEHVDMDAAEVTFLHPSEVVVARRGTPGPPGAAERHPIRLGNRLLGELLIWVDGAHADADHRSEIVATMMRPVALAFDNIALLRDIAARAVQEERLRLARELHDEIGPSVASLGLGLDVIVLRSDLGAEERIAQLEMLRQAATRIVEQIRGIVEDLRSPRSTSLVECANAVVSEIDANGPSIMIDLDEQRPPRDRLAADLSAILTEAIRNAAEHAQASKILVSGEIDRDRGHFEVVDDGAGFDPTTVPEGHWGLVGMAERARRLDATLAIDTGAAGTRIALRWGAAT